MIKQYDLTVYTYNSEKRQHEAEEFYFDSIAAAQAAIYKLRHGDAESVCFMDLYEWNDEDDCYDFTERYEPFVTADREELERLIDRLEALRTYCDIASEDENAVDFWEDDVKALGRVIELLREGMAV